jgi:hypothetical protein
MGKILVKSEVTSHFELIEITKMKDYEDRILQVYLKGFDTYDTERYPSYLCEVKERSDIVDCYERCQSLENRLKHLLSSKLIRAFDEKYSQFPDEYRYDIKYADYIYEYAKLYMSDNNISLRDYP